MNTSSSEPALDPTTTRCPSLHPNTGLRLSACPKGTQCPYVHPGDGSAWKAAGVLTAAPEGDWSAVIEEIKSRIAKRKAAGGKATGAKAAGGTNSVPARAGERTRKSTSQRPQGDLVEDTEPPSSVSPGPGPEPPTKRARTSRQPDEAPGQAGQPDEAPCFARSSAFVNLTDVAVDGSLSPPKPALLEATFASTTSATLIASSTEDSLLLIKDKVPETGDGGETGSDFSILIYPEDPGASPRHSAPLLFDMESCVPTVVVANDRSTVEEAEPAAISQSAAHDGMAVDDHNVERPGPVDSHRPLPNTSVPPPEAVISPLEADTDVVAAAIDLDTSRKRSFTEMETDVPSCTETANVWDQGTELQRPLAGTRRVNSAKASALARLTAAVPLPATSIGRIALLGGIMIATGFAASAFSPDILSFLS